MTPPSHCLECHTPLGPKDTGGVCPKCLLKLGLASQLASGSLPATAQGLRDDGSIIEPFDFGGYRILRLLGKGGMGAAYEAEQLESGRRVALKVLGHTLDTPELHARFVLEGQLAASVRHPNVVAVLAADEIEGTPAIAMELLHEGTLKDRVKTRGPLAVAGAVDAILQIIDGLEAAHDAGVLHRDVKPANCFVGADGVVKVGDFGLSISTLAKVENSLTQSGAVLGTPAFAAPEQLRGEEIDIRADIYAVGATLYYLLTGKPTHDAENVVALIASVLEKKPVDVRKLRPDVPASLSRIVMRCLEKPRAARPANYAALRADLEPFGSTAPTPATVGLRIIAGVFDNLIAYLPEFVALAVWGTDISLRWLIERDAASLLWLLFGMMFGVAYFAVQEAVWGTTLGKMICRLRVQTAQGGTPGWRASLLRSAIYNSVVVITPLVGLMLYTPVEAAIRGAETTFPVTDWIEFVAFIALFITMRRRNGFAAVHDLASGTRVVSSREIDTPAPFPFEAPLPIPMPGGTSIGSFAVTARSETLIEAIDEKLRRRVWIIPRRSDDPPISRARRDVARRTRLHWLQGRRKPGDSWDAFEAPAGMPLVDLLDGSQPWTRVRRWLCDLADEAVAARSDGTLPNHIGAHHVWISTNSHAIILDMPAPGVAERPLHDLADAAGVQRFLSEIATAALTPFRTPVLPRHGANLAPVIPLHAREFLRTLRSGRFEAPEILAGNLHAVATRPARVTQRRRLLSLLAGPAAAFAFAALIFALATGGKRRMDAWWHEKYSGLPPLHRASELLQRVDLTLAERAALEVHIAGHHGRIVRDEGFWHLPEVRDYYWPDAENFQTTLLKIVDRQGDIAPNDLRQADETLIRRPFPGFESWIRTETLAMAVGILCAGLVLGGLGTLAVTFASGIPIGLRMAGLAPVDENGDPLSRWRASLRSSLAWGPALIILFSVASGSFLTTTRSMALTGAAALALCFLIFTAVAARNPSRSLLDRICRTRVVPR